VTISDAMTQTSEIMALALGGFTALRTLDRCWLNIINVSFADDADIKSHHFVLEPAATVSHISQQLSILSRQSRTTCLRLVE